jgi:hypothetical protein
MDTILSHAGGVSTEPGAAHRTELNVRLFPLGDESVLAELVFAP